MLVEDDEEEEAEGEKPEDIVWIWPQNQLVVEIFFAIDTQWLRAGMEGARVGLNYDEARKRLRDRGIVEQEPYMDDLRVMEMGALEVFAEQARRRRAAYDRKMKAARR